MAYLPFGYEMIDGTITVCSEESDRIRQVFEAYVGGKSYERIACSLSDPVWNKHKVKRVLEDVRYLGARDYPKIIDTALYQRAREVRTSKTSHYAPLPAHVREVKKKACCGVCGSRVLRTTKQEGRSRWACKEGCGSSARTDDAFVMDQLGSLFDALAHNITAPLCETPEQDEDMVAVGQLPIDEGNAELEPAQLYEQIKSLAQATYAHCPDEYVRRKQMEIDRYLQSHQNDSDALDMTLLQIAVDCIRIFPEGQMDLMLYTGHTITMEEKT